MPKVRASSGMMGTTFLPMPGSRRSLLRRRAKAMVVETRVSAEPLWNSS